MNIVLATLNAKYIHTSLALRYLKAYAEKDFPQIAIKEFTINDVALNIVSEIYQLHPDVVAFSCYIWNIEETIPVIKMLKQVKPDVKIIIGGPEVSYDIDEWLQRLPGVDFIVYGEGEETFHHLLTEIAADQKYHMVFGIGYLKDGQPVITPPRPKVNLTEIPSPYRDLEDLKGLKNRIVYYECSRGCPFTCSYCLSSIEFGVRYFPMERVKEDLLRLIKAGIKTIKFVDRTFNINRSYAMEVFQFLIDNHRDTIFQFEITADIMRPEVLDYLTEHAPPCIFRFEIGVQSTNDETNAIVKRRQNFQKLTRTVVKIKESGKIDQHLDLIAGLPGEDYQSFRKTFNDVFALKPEELQLGFLKMLRGTEVRKNADQYGYVYMEHAPYEILYNDVLSFDDVIRIKRVEDVLEKYWNAHRMDTTVQYLIAENFDSPFDFFQEFGDYWESKGWRRIGHQLEDLFVRLLQFLKDRNIRNMDVAVGLMKFDYLRGHKYKPRKTWWEFSLDKQEFASIMKKILEQPARMGDKFHGKGWTERELHKHGMIEILPFNLKEYLETGTIKKQKSLLLVTYDPHEKGGTEVFSRLF
ncbi:B12-binding domain-containing radical SAM protein [Microaerobacter geothermalis]|uniref:B12-binding domain-containing radical SAM protein n=1 Tax=Microaerobacter geothermalis TaxID=674972 RepID=UPI001F19F46C|nr:B12-binding domain-containing radical SAM protein [Microaerobacter geothermalis]MCF6092498.1 B12-binding domain-containing radical SAM protein [Microaerobacter geothermalis]